MFCKVANQQALQIIPFMLHSKSKNIRKTFKKAIEIYSNFAYSWSTRGRMRRT